MLGNLHTSEKSPIPARKSRSDLHDLPHVTGWEAYDLHDLAKVSKVGFVLSLYMYRSGITSNNGRYGYYCRWSRS